MATRPGDVDPGVLIWAQKQHRLDAGVRTLVVHAPEDVEIATECRRLLG